MNRISGQVLRIIMVRALPHKFNGSGIADLSEFINILFLFLFFKHIDCSIICKYRDFFKHFGFFLCESIPGKCAGVSRVSIKLYTGS